MTAQPSLERARELVREGLKEARDALNAISDPQQALDTARSFLAETLREVRMALTNARAEQAARIVEDESMSMADLGRKVGVSRQAIHKEVTRGRRAKAAAEEEIAT